MPPFLDQSRKKYYSNIQELSPVILAVTQTYYKIQKSIIIFLLWEGKQILLPIGIIPHSKILFLSQNFPPTHFNRSIIHLMNMAAPLTPNFYVKLEIPTLLLWPNTTAKTWSDIINQHLLSPNFYYFSKKIEKTNVIIIRKRLNALSP